MLSSLHGKESLQIVYNSDNDHENNNKKCFPRVRPFAWLVGCMAVSRSFSRLHLLRAPPRPPSSVGLVGERESERWCAAGWVIQSSAATNDHAPTLRADLFWSRRRGTHTCFSVRSISASEHGVYNIARTWCMPAEHTIVVEQPNEAFLWMKLEHRVGSASAGPTFQLLPTEVSWATHSLTNRLLPVCLLDKHATIFAGFWKCLCMLNGTFKIIL